MQIKIEQSYKRLDKFLFQYFESLPLSLLQRLIRKYKIKINNKKSKANSPLIKGDVVYIYYKFEINNDLCVLCDECLLVRPVNECIKELSSKNIDKSGEVSFEKLNPGKSHGIYHGLLSIDPKVCVRCGECEKACPTGAIKLSKVSKINAPA